MDNITHTLTGLMLSRAGLDRWHPRAALVLMLSANAPDLDVVSAGGGALSYLHYHRWLTHSIAMLPFMALLTALAVCGISRSFRSFKQAYGLALAGVASHLLLDWTNAYGIRLWSPFSSRWLALDLVNVVDVWIWAVLALAVLAPALSRMVAMEIGASAGRGRNLAIFALVFLMAYGFGRHLMHERVLAVLGSRLYQGTAPLKVAAFPEAVNPFAWKGVVESAGSFTVYQVDVLGDFDPDSGSVLYKPQVSPAIEAAHRTEVFKAFADFDRVPLWRATPESEPEKGTRVELLDLRFPFVATALVDEQNRVRRAWLHY